MKYFTVELLDRLRSHEEDVAAHAHEEWEEALGRYQRRERRIKSSLPQGVRRFIDEHVCLHDARLLKMGMQGDTFVMILEMEPPSQELVILTFTVDGTPQIEETNLKDKNDFSFVTWMYEEWDIDRRQRCSFAVLLSNGWIVRLHCRQFRHLIVQELNPGKNGHAAPFSSTPVSQSA